MIRIGEFSKLAHVSIKTLHYYGVLGLLNPVHTDRYTGYRYYELEQLQDLNRILALKELGFSLEQIAQLLDENLSLPEMRGMLKMKQLELMGKLEEERSRLNRVGYRLSQLEEGNRPHQWDIVIKEIGDQTLLTAQGEAAGEEAVPAIRQHLAKQLQHQLDEARLKPAGPWLGLINDQPYEDNHLEINLAVPINLRPDQREGDWDGSGVSLDWLPGSPETACIIHRGKLSALPGVYSHLYGWIGKNGYQFSGIHREVYLSEIGSESISDQGHETILTEVQCPVQRAKVPVSLQSSIIGKEEKMEPTYTTKPAFQAVGISYIGKNENNEIPGTWDIFNQRIKEIKPSDDQCTYGLCFTTPDESIGEFKPGEFEYVAAIEVAEGADVPDGMVYRHVPAYKYAVFTHHGKLDSLGDTYKYIYETWMPQTDEKIHPDKFDMEVYTDEFIFASDDSKFYIYVAVVE